jgi:hypothetical protein
MASRRAYSAWRANPKVPWTQKPQAIRAALVAARIVSSSRRMVHAAHPRLPLPCRSRACETWRVINCPISDSCHRLRCRRRARDRRELRHVRWPILRRAAPPSLPSCRLRCREERAAKGDNATRSYTHRAPLLDRTSAALTGSVVGALPDSCKFIGGPRTGSAREPPTALRQCARTVEGLAGSRAEQRVFHSLRSRR